METLIPIIIAGVACFALFFIKDLIGGKGAIFAAVVVVFFALFGGGFVQDTNDSIVNGATNQAQELFNFTGFDGALDKIRGN